MPKRMLFAKLQTVRPAEGAKQRWKDCVQHDLRYMGLEDGWSDLAHVATERAVKKWETQKSEKDKERYEQKKAGVGVKCTFRGCTFIGENERGLKSHWGRSTNCGGLPHDEAEDEDDN